MGMNITNDIDWDALRDELEELEKEQPTDEAFTIDDYYARSNPEAYNKEHADNNDSELLQVGAKRKEEISEDLDNGYITDQDIQDSSYLAYPEKKIYRSLLLEIFTVDQCIELEKISRSFSISNNQKIDMIKEKLNQWGIQYNPLGGGTNRYGFTVDGYCIKVACDKDGKIDNKREFKYSMKLQPYVIKAYETYSDGLLAVFEYVESFTIDDFWKNQEKMREILSDIGSNFLIGDVGVTTKNYVNWGYRDDGSIVILDFAYIYSVSYKSFTCSCNPNASLYYNKDFTDLICPVCGKKYSFSDIRMQITREDQDNEIGNLDDQGIILTKTEEELRFNPKFVYGATEKIKNLLMKKKKKEDRKLKSFKNNDPYGITTLEEIEEILND